MPYRLFKTLQEAESIISTVHWTNIIIYSSLVTMPMDVFTYSLYHVNTNGKTRDSHRSAISPSLNISLEKKAFAETYAPESDNYFSNQGCRTGSHLHGLDVVWCTYSDDICSVYSKVEVKKT